jgi:hypothetical protein
MGRPRKVNYGSIVANDSANTGVNSISETGIIIEGKPDGDTGTQGPIIGSENQADGIGSAETVDPATAEYQSTGTGPKRRGRPKGSKNQSIQKATNLEGLESILLSLHMMGAALLTCPELVIEAAEAKRLSSAIAQVAAQYPEIELAPKMVAWVNLILVLGAVEGTRVIAIANRVKRERNQKPRLVPITQTLRPNGAPVPGQSDNATQNRPSFLSPSQLNPSPPEDN